MSKIDYKEYLNSDHWRKIKDESALIWGHRCVMCHSADNICRHHVFYRFDRKETHPSEIIPLCKECHDAFHRSGRMFGKPTTEKSLHRQFTEMVDEICKRRSSLVESAFDIFKRVWMVYYRNHPHDQFTKAANDSITPQQMIERRGEKEDRKRLNRIAKLKKQLAKLEGKSPIVTPVAKPTCQIDVSAYIKDMKKEWRSQNWSV